MDSCEKGEVRRAKDENAGASPFAFRPSPFKLSCARTSAGVCLPPSMTARIFALFIALLTLANLLGDLLWPGVDAHIWWISFGRSVPAWLSQIALAVSTLVL